MTISRTIVDHVLSQGQGVITSDAPADKRFGPAQSIVDYGIREAICVPDPGPARHARRPLRRHSAPPSRRLRRRGKDGPKQPVLQDHLMLMVAIGHQAGLAIENTALYQAKLQAERLAAVGQTIATLSHHIKNILQGIRGGSYLIDMGLNDKDEAIVRRGLDDRREEPGEDLQPGHGHALLLQGPRARPEPADLNETVGRRRRADAVAGRRAGRRARLATGRSDLPEVLIDPDGIHRAVLNIVTNAIDAAEDVEGGRVLVSTAVGRRRR